MVEEDLKMAALESEADPENKIPNFIQGFLNYNDFLEFFIENYEGEASWFEKTLRELDFDYAMNFVESGEDSVIKVIHQDEKLYVVLKKMLDYHISMAPIVDNATNKTIGFFFLKDIFWLLRSGKFEFLYKSMLWLLKTIYKETQDGVSLPSEEGEEESEGETIGVNDEEKMFLEEFENDDNHSSSMDSKNRSKSLALDKRIESKTLSDNVDRNKNYDLSISQNDMINNDLDQPLSDNVANDNQRRGSVKK